MLGAEIVFQVPLNALLGSGFAFPNDEHSPVQVAQRFLDAEVPCDVFREFSRPEDDARLWRVGITAVAVPMPEASVDEHRNPMPWKHEVRTTWEICAVQTETKAQFVGDTANLQFGYRIPMSDFGHHLTSTAAVYDVGHG